MEYTITPLTPHTGAEVRGIDLSEGIDGETRAALNRAFAEHHVLVVRGQEFTPPQFIAAAQVFGELFQHDKREMHVPGYPQIYYVSNEQTVPGKRYISGETFHTDHSNHPTPPKATMLFPVSFAEPWRRHPIRQYARGLGRSLGNDQGAHRRAQGAACLSESLPRNVAANFNKVSSPPRKRGPRACPWLEQGATGRTLAAPGFPLSRE